MGLWLACIVNDACYGFRQGWISTEILEGVASGKSRAPSCLPESQRSAMAPHILLNRRSKRILRRELPASRQYGALRHLVSYSLSRHSFLECVARFSVNGRVRVYRLDFKTRLCQRRPVNAFARCGEPNGRLARLSLGLFPAFMWPD